MLGKILFNYPLFDRSHDFNTEELSSIELAGRTAEKVNEMVEIVNTVDGRIEGKEDATNITINRKLSPNGNFTGSILGRLASMVLLQADTNTDRIKYLVNQFADGQTGLVVDGGFFADSVIDKNYDGGVF